MSDSHRSRFHNEEGNFFYYFSIIWKRKNLFLGVFFIITIGAATITFFTPKIYRGEYNLDMATHYFTDILPRVNSNEKPRLMGVLPQTFQYVDDIKLTYTEDSVMCKLNVVIDTKDTANIEPVLSELMAYINNLSYYKKSVDERKERLRKELDVLLKAIAHSDAVLNSYSSLLHGDKPVAIVLNPAEFYSGKMGLIRATSKIERALKNDSGIEIVTGEIYSSHVKPRMFKNLGIGILSGVLAGVLMVFLAEFIHKINALNPKE